MYVFNSHLWVMRGHAYTEGVFVLPQNISSTRKQEGKSAQVLLLSLCTLLTTTRCSLMKDEPVKLPGLLTQLQNLAAKFNKLQSSLVDQALIIITQSRKWNYVMLKDFDYGHR